MTALPRTAAILASVGPRAQQPLRGSQRERSRAHSLSPIAAKTHVNYQKTKPLTAMQEGLVLDLPQA